MPVNRIAVGIIRKAHGLRGEASVEPWTNTLDRFSQLRTVTLVSPDGSDTRDAAIETARPHGGRALVKFAGLDSPEALRDLQGWTIEIPLSEARPLAAGEYFLHDLIGMTLVDADGTERGLVTAVYEGGGGVLLAVDGPGGAFEVPFAAEICTSIDLEGRKIVVAMPQGLDELDRVED